MNWTIEHRRGRERLATYYSDAVTFDEVRADLVSIAREPGDHILICKGAPRGSQQQWS